MSLQILVRRQRFPAFRTQKRVQLIIAVSPHVNVEFVKFEETFFAHRALMRLHPFVPQEVIDELVAHNKQFIADRALVRRVFYVILRVSSDVGEGWEDVVTKFAGIFAVLGAFTLVRLQMRRQRFR